MPAQRFEDFLALGVTEIREYGGASIQVVRRLRAALLELESSVLPEYAPPSRPSSSGSRHGGAAFGGTPDAERRAARPTGRESAARRASTHDGALPTTGTP